MQPLHLKIITTIKLTACYRVKTITTTSIRSNSNKVVIIYPQHLTRAAKALPYLKIRPPSQVVIVEVSIPIMQL